MLDLKAIAAAREMGIPDDQLERITPVLQKLHEDLQRVIVNPPAGSDSAIQFSVDREG
jgi:hypothetical protein